MHVYSNFELRKFVAPELIFGLDARLLAVRYAKNLGASKVLIVTDPGILATDMVAEITNELVNHRIEYTVFSEVHENPRDYDVMRGVEVFLSAHCNIIIAIGGGSPMDCAKAIGIVSTNGGNILDYEGVDKVKIPGPPLICIPTTSGSSADVSQFSIILDSKRNVKIAIISKTVVPDVALIDPKTLVTMNKFLTACSSMDALTHAIEAYVSTAQSPITDLHSLEAVKIINNNILKAVENPGDINYLDKLMLGSLYAGFAFSNASLGAVHAMAHSLGGMYDLHHGECNAMLLEHIIKYNFHETQGRYTRIAQAMNLPVENKSSDYIMNLLTDRIASLNKSLGIKDKLSGITSEKESISILAENALRDPCMITNPVFPSKEDLELIYEKIL
jgi:alcohol dehydrogenase class IV